MQFLKDFKIYIVIIIIVLLFKQFVITPASVVGTSMDPTLKNNDVLLVDRISYKFKNIERFDIIIINHSNPKHLIKRVVGLPGESVKYENGFLYVDGKKIEEPFLDGILTKDFNIEEIGYNTIPNDKYFVVGDNRNNSNDSREVEIGLIDKNSVLGKAFLRVWPLGKFQTIKHK